MSNQPTQSAPSFTPVKFRARKDGWTPQKQVAFVAALAATASVGKAARSVGMTRRSAYNLYHRADAASLRAAWAAALDQGCNRLADALLDRAIHGTVTPIFYKGEKVGERRTFDNRLGMWSLERRMPHRFGTWRDRHVFRRDDPDGGAGVLQHMLRALVQDVVADELGRARPVRPTLVTERHLGDPAEAEAEESAAARMREIRQRIENDLWSERLKLIERGEIDPTDPNSYADWQARQAAARASQRAGPTPGDPDSSQDGACKL